MAHEKDGLVREYDGVGGTVWEFQVPLFGKEPAAGATGHGPDAWGNQCYSVRSDCCTTVPSKGRQSAFEMIVR